MRKTALATLILLALLVVAGAAIADDRKHMYSIADAFDHPDYGAKLDDDIRFFFGDQKHPGVKQELGEFVTNKKTRAFGKSDRDACRWVLLSAMISLRDRARAEGGNAVVNIRSYYKKHTVSSETEFECHAGAAVAGVALIGEVVELAN